MRFSFFFAFVALFVPAPAFAGSGDGAPLSLAEAQKLAASDAPQLTAQTAAVRAAEQSVISAGELPDPKLIAGVDNLPVDTADRFSVTRDFMTMRKIGVMQDFTRGEKLKLRGERAEAEVRKETAMLAAAEVNLRRDVALAWIDVYFTERQLALLKELLGENELVANTAAATLAGGKGQVSDPFMAKLGAEQVTDRMIDAKRAIARARAMLARWVGSAAERPLTDSPSFDELAHPHVLSLTNLDAHPHLAVYGPMQDMADREVRLADAAKHPDWSLEASYGQRGPNFSNMVSIEVRIDLPIFQSRRQDPAAAAKVALANQVRAEAEAARREHEAEVKGWIVDWDAEKQRLARFDSSLIPLARERNEVVLAAYRGGKGDLASVIDARKAEIDVRLNRLQTELELARTWAQLNFLTLEPAKDSP